MLTAKIHEHHHSNNNIVFVAYYLSIQLINMLQVLLKCLPHDRSEWLSIIKRNRSNYAQLKSQVCLI